jgi:hypothetical protein
MFKFLCFFVCEELYIILLEVCFGEVFDGVWIWSWLAVLGGDWK